MDVSIKYCLEMSCDINIIYVGRAAQTNCASCLLLCATKIYLEEFNLICGLCLLNGLSEVLNVWEVTGSFLEQCQIFHCFPQSLC